jgi:hypothetical protein
MIPEIDIWRVATYGVARGVEELDRAVLRDS